VTNTVTGCKSYGTFLVYDGQLNADFAANPETGYPPLTVTFTNLSASSTTSGVMSSIWSFGNGSSQTGTAGLIATSNYNSPGTYTVMLIATKGACTDTAYKVIKIDLPSKLEIPNIFTPNADGSNDVFSVRAANLTRIDAIIFDRWGNRVYEVSSSTGNIAWDGKNLGGKNCAEGVYFYIIKAEGKDTKTYEYKGNVTLMR
jgi:gliding motility-associated-like protein